MPRACSGICGSASSVRLRAACRRGAVAAAGVGESTATAWVGRWRRTGSSEAKSQKGRSGSPLAAHAPWLLALIAAEADLTLGEIGERLAARGVRAAVSSIWWFYDRHGIRLKKPCTPRSSGARMWRARGTIGRPRSSRSLTPISWSLSTRLAPPPIWPARGLSAAYRIVTGRPPPWWRGCGSIGNRALCHRPGARNLRGRLAQRRNGELSGRVAAHHASDQRLRHIGFAQTSQRIPGARGIVVRVARPPYDLSRKILWQFLDQPLFGVEPEHDVAVLPQFLRLGADRIMMQQRNDASRGLHLFEHLLHPGRLTMGDDDLHRGIALHDREAEQGRGDEHVVVEPIGQDRRQRMTERRRACKRCRLTGTAAAAGKRSAASTRRDRLHEPVLDLFEKRTVRGPFRVPQPRRRMHRRCDPEPLQFGP